MMYQIILATFVLAALTSAIPTPPTCPAAGSGIYFPDPEHCNQYWECSNGLAHHMTCPGGLIWNQDKLTCDYPGEGDCDPLNPTLPPKDTTTEPATTPRPETTTAEPEWTTAEPSSEPTTEEPLTEPEPEPTTEPSIGSTDGHWTPDPRCPYPSEELVYLPYEGDCHLYWECFEGNIYLYECPVDLWFNFEYSYCDYHENVKCEYAIRK